MSTGEVPRLNLAPKRRKPLSLWNPLDYLQLLGWVFFFPQALRWYVEVFGEEKGLSDCKTWVEQQQWWSHAPIRRNFWLQGLLLTVIAPVATACILSRFEVLVNPYGVAFGAAFGVAFGAAFGLTDGVTRGVALGVAGGVAFGVAGGVASGVAGGVAFGVAFSVARSVAGGVAYDLALGVAFGLAFGLAFGVAGGVADGVACGVAFGVAMLRPDVWLVIAIYRRLLPRNRTGVWGRITALPLPNSTQQLSAWLNHDWPQAVDNLNELLAYTLQFIPVIEAANQSLAKLPPELLLLRVSQLAAAPFDWDLVLYVSASLDNKLRERFVNGFVYLPGFLKRRITARFSTEPRLDTPARATAAGFWYLHEDQPHRAAEAFSHVRHIPHGQEMEQLARCIALALNAENLNDNTLSNELSIPNSHLLRADTWPAISRFRSIVDDAQIIYHSYSRSARSLALNRALGTLAEILNKATLIPQAERYLIVTIAASWIEKLLAIATDVGEATPTQPVQNPYVAGDPVEGNLFVGRGEVIEQLEELWLTNSQLQSVVLFGHRRMGKTSILKNLSRYLGNNLQVVYINLLNLGAASEGAGEVLITLSDAISAKLSTPPPDDETLLRLPYPTFRRFIQTINQSLKDNQGLIIALDEFEKIEDLIRADRLSPDFLGFLRGLLQMSPKIAFAFAGLHTLEEMTADYFNPLFASVLPIRIGFFTIGETRELLANPAEDFTLDYQPDTLNEIYRLTAGQPYLTQLLGFQLVRQYNHQVFDQGRDRTPIFTLEDLNTVIHHTDFFAKGRYYFTGVWNQAGQDAAGQQAILKLLAEIEEGRSHADIRRKTNLSADAITLALNTLARHDVVTEHNGRWKTIVPLFRQWVLKNQQVS